MIEKTVLNSGLTIISEFNPGLPSFALSYSLKSGSRAESTFNNGIHHFMEHMLFKGSESYDLRTIARISDQLGGNLNAFTGKEISQFYLKAIDEKFELAFHLLTDIVINATFPEEEFVKEKGVILQEIREAEDNPDTRSFEIFFEQIFGLNPLGYPVSGKEDQVVAFTRDKIYQYYKKKYSPDNLVLSAAGNIDHYSLVEIAKGCFSGYREKIPSQFLYKEPGMDFRIQVKPKSALNQTYLFIGFKGISLASPARYPFSLMNEILGSGMSSRLFQKIREDRGLAYTIFSFVDCYCDCGILVIYAVVEPGKTRAVLKSIKDEVMLLKEKGIDEDEMERAKDHLKSSIILGLENNLSKMRFNLNQELYLTHVMTINEILESINKISSRDIMTLLDRYLTLNRSSILLYGNVKPEQCEGIGFD